MNFSFIRIDRRSLHTLRLLLFTTLLVLPSLGWSQKAKKITIKKGVGTIKGKLARGKNIELRWAADSSVACWPTTKDQHYKGHHVLHKLSLPTRSTLTVELKPKGDKAINLYAYAASGHPLPPKLYRACCEASFNGSSQETVKVMTINPTDVVIGVAGAEGVIAGAYELKVKIE